VSVRILTGDCRQLLEQLEHSSVHTIVTSPPYWGLRDYGTGRWEGGDDTCQHSRWNLRQDHAHGRWLDTRGTQPASAAQGTPYKQTCARCGARRTDNQIGMEATPQDYVHAIVGVLEQARRILRDDGTLWLILGDTYAANRGYQVHDRVARGAARGAGGNMHAPGLKPKDLVMIPARVALALQEAGWYLRQDIIWSKHNPMPESVRDRCTTSHEHIFLLAKNEQYYFDAEAIQEPAVSDHRSGNGFRRDARCSFQNADGTSRGNEEQWTDVGGTRNRRSVWHVNTQPFKEAHFATFPPALVEPCILAGCPRGGTVLDPFAGAGTTGLVADRLHRSAVLIELNDQYAEMARRRIAGAAPLFAEIL
jgi:DNA modification methylase